MKSTIVKPSQWVNVIWIFILVISSVMLIVTYLPTLDVNRTLTSPLWAVPLIVSAWKIIKLSCWSFEIQEDGGDVLVERQGVFTTHTVEINYFRIKSIQIVKPLYFRFLGLSTINVITSEPFKPVLVLYAVENGDNIANFLKNMSIAWREAKGVHETDFHNF